MMTLGSLERRFSYASWTAPSHYNLLMGLMPHRSPTHVYASEVYKREYLQFRERLGIPDVEFAGLVPQLYLPHYLQQQYGYFTQGLVSLPVLNPATPLAAGFDDYRLMPRHNDMAAMLPELHFEAERPSFILLNVGETHYPYALPDEPEDQWPRISGVNGVLRKLDDKPEDGAVPDGPATLLDQEKLDQLRERQVAAVRYLDGVVERLFQAVPTGTWIVITSDHGELFGEDGYFGHGPIHHDKVYEVPFIEGRIR